MLLRYHIMFLIVLLGCGGGGAWAGDASPSGAALSERLGNQVPLDAMFVDQDGQRVRLGSLCDGQHPLLLIPAYFHCPMLCGLVLNRAVEAASGIAWSPGREYRIAVMSFDPDDHAFEALNKQRAVLAHTSPTHAFRREDWPFLTGDSKDIDAVLNAIGEHVKREGGDYSHPAVMVVLDGKGVICRYLYGIDTRPRDLELALMEASAGKVGTLSERVLLYCYRYDPATRRYGLFVVGFLRLGGVLVLALSVVTIWLLTRRSRLRKSHE